MGVPRAGTCAACRATAGCWFRGVPERYVEGADTRGRPEGRPYPRSEQAIREISGPSNNGTVMRSADTSKAAATLQIEVLRRMGPEARLQAAIDLCRTSRVLLLEGVHKRHPEYNARQAELAVIRLTLPTDLFLAAYPEAEGILP